MKLRQPTSPLRAFLLLLILIVLLPALFYSVYEINSLSSTEQLMEEIYRRQMDAVLFSLNQYAWDVVGTWAASVDNAAAGSAADTGMALFLSRTRPVRAVLLADSAGSGVRLYGRGGRLSAREDEMERVLSGDSRRLEQLRRFARQNYRRLEPVALDTTSGAEGDLLILFSRLADANVMGVAGLMLDPAVFVRDVLGAKIRDATGQEFVLAVFRGEEPEPVIAPEPAAAGDLRQRRNLWVLPSYTVGIGPRGATIEEVLRGRFIQNLVLIIFVDIILVVGAWLAYRLFRREMELVRMKSDFVSTVSHELRTPLALIRMYAETLEMGRLQDEDKRREYHATILRESERLSRLVNNILSFSRIEAGRKQYHFGEVQVNSVVEGVLETYRHHLEANGFTPELRLAKALPLIHADAEALSEALINLVDNAVKYSRQEKFIRVSTGRDGAEVYLEVEDHGVGIAPQHHRRVFETFYRVTDGDVHDTKGTGLGLALVQHIVDAHGGRVTLTSTPGEGSRFRMSFPVTNGGTGTSG